MTTIRSLKMVVIHYVLKSMASIVQQLEFFVTQHVEMDLLLQTNNVMITIQTLLMAVFSAIKSMDFPVLVNLRIVHRPAATVYELQTKFVMTTIQI